MKSEFKQMLSKLLLRFTWNPFACFPYNHRGTSGKAIETVTKTEGWNKKYISGNERLGGQKRQ